MKELKSRFEASYFPLTVKGIAAFSALWLPIGFSLGLSVLMGPVRWLTDFARGNAWIQTHAEGFEGIAIKLIILVYVGISFFVAKWLYGICRHTEARHVLWGLPGLCWCFAAASLWLLLSPQHLKADRGEEVATSHRFTFGPYPDQARLVSLKAEGYDGVIALLHPAVVPFEPVYLEKERIAAKEAGIELVEAPMLPWVSSNEESLDKIRELALSGNGRYYVHCYLGKDRVRAVQRLLAGLIEEGVESENREVSKIAGRNSYERGPIFRLRKGSYLTPYLTDEAFVSHVIGGGIDRVVSLLDQQQGDKRNWHQKEKALCESYRVPLLALPLSETAYDPARVLDAARQVRLLEGNLVVHDFFSDRPLSQAFLNAYEFDLPPLHPELLGRRLERGALISLSANLALGPRPTADEFQYLSEKFGIREFLYMGSANDIAAIEDQRQARSLGIRWRIAYPRFDRLDRLEAENGGPAYLYCQPDPPFRRLLGEGMERGKPVMLAPDVWMTPQPTPSEWAELLGAGYFAHVLNLLNPNHSSEARWVAQDEPILARHAIPQTNKPTEPDHVNPIEIRKAAQEALNLPRPLLIHAFRSDSARAKSFQQSFWGGRPVWLTSYLRGPLEKRVKLLAPNVLRGPRPTDEEVGNLVEAGAAGFIYIGPPLSEEALAESARFNRLRRPWQALSPNDQSVVEYMIEEGPWFIYGPELEDEIFGVRIEKRLAPPVLTRAMFAREASSRPVAVASAAPIQAPPPTLAIMPLSAFIQGVLPTPRQVVLTAPVFTLWAGLAMAFCGRKRRERRWKVGYTRKLFHFCIFTSATIVQAYGGLSATCLLGGIVSLLVIYTTWRGKEFSFYDALARPKDAPRETLFILVPLVTTAAAGILANFLFGKFALVGYMVGGWGDAVGEPAGTRWGTIRYRVPSLGGVPAHRSLQGSAAVLIASAIAALITLLLMGYAPNKIMIWVAVIAFFSALAEGLSPHGTDNLTVPLVAAGLAFWGLS